MKSMKKRHSILARVFAFCPLILFLIFNYQNFLFYFSLILGLIVFPYVLSIQPPKGNYRFAIITGILGLTLAFFRNSSLYYFMSMFFTLFLIEKLFGKTNLLPALLILIISPVISSVVYVWSFPIRLALSDIAGKVLRAANFDIEIQGNIILMNGNQFSVDEACIGLNMVTTALVLGIVIMAYFEKKYQQTIRLIPTIPLFIAMLFLIVVANFVRLLTLIIFYILPENPLHDIVGLLSLVVYALVPFYFLVGFFFKKIIGKTTLPSSTSTVIDETNSYQTNIYTLNLFEKMTLALLFSLQLYISPQFLQTKIENTAAVHQIEIKGFEKNVTDKGVLKFQNEEALLYIKPPVRFFEGSHDPRFCWKGSGYDFSNIELQPFNGQIIYTAILTKEKDKLHTAWWYQSDDYRTPYDWTWRWKNVSAKQNFYMVNISCEDKTKLEKWLQHFSEATFDLGGVKK
jgi:exosortase N